MSSETSVARSMLMRHLALRQTAAMPHRARSVTPGQNENGLTKSVPSANQADKNFAEVLASTSQRQDGILQANTVDQQPVGRRSTMLQSGETRSLAQSRVENSVRPVQGNGQPTELATSPAKTSAPPGKLTPSPAMPIKWDEESIKIAGVPFADVIVATSKKYGVSPGLVAAVVKAESEFNPLAQSDAGAKGLMQLMDGTAESVGVSNIFDPSQNVEGGVKYLDSLLKKYNGNATLALAAYNAGPGAVDEFGGIPPYEETTNYVSRVLGYWRGFGGGSQSEDTSG